MKRNIIKDLVEWKNSQDRMPLIVRGARQVGKTWIMREFGKQEYKNIIYANFDDNKKLSNYFEPDLNTKRIIATLSSEFGMPITPQNTLIIFDEIQECNRALVSLKYFCENAPQYHIIAAGSFLGVATHEGASFPVGKVDMLTMYPMSFYEFLSALGEDILLAAIKKLDFKLIAGLSYKFTNLLKTYLYVGGMPKAVASYAQYKDIERVRTIQNNILEGYTADFSKHIKGVTIPKVKMLWDYIPYHLAKEKKKFIYKDIKQGGRASEFEDALNWLINCGLVYKVSKTLSPKIPLASYGEREAFKLYMLDTGLLCAKSKIDIKTFFETDPKIFDDFQGALMEQYVLQELKTIGSFPVFYWGRERGTAEVDFIIQFENEIIPIEVKSTINTKSKSLDVYLKEYAPDRAIRISLKNYGLADKLYSIPLYLIESLKDICAS
ncbi:MAG: ATP-binding protein, partial [Elusimicrobiota bacterium]|nr:ATP-binding protein [Elusimicrobiota bacterium]